MTPTASFCLAAVAVLAVACASPRDTGERRETPEAVQTVYREGVPHTDRMGRLRFGYDGARSFFPIGLYHGLTGRRFGRDYGFATVAAAGFNTIHAWEGQKLDAVIGDARANGLQVIHHNPSDAEVAKYAGDANLLAWYLDEEPTGQGPRSEMPRLLAAFHQRRKEIRAIDGIHPVMVIDGPMKDGREDDWLAWAKAGDVSAHFYYPVTPE